MKDVRFGTFELYLGRQNSEVPVSQHGEVLVDEVQNEVEEDLQHPGVTHAGVHEGGVEGDVEKEGVWLFLPIFHEVPEDTSFYRDESTFRVLLDWDSLPFADVDKQRPVFFLW